MKKMLLALLVMPGVVFAMEQNNNKDATETKEVICAPQEARATQKQIEGCDGIELVQDFWKSMVSLGECLRNNFLTRQYLGIYRSNNGSIEAPLAQNSVEKTTDAAAVEAYRKNAVGLRDIIFDKYKKGTLSSGVPLAKVDSIAIEVVNPDTFVSKKEYRRPIEDPGYLLKQGANGVAVELDTVNPEIYLSTRTWFGFFHNKKNDDIRKTHAILHELAHALDGCIKKPQEERRDCYAWLNEDVKNYPDSALSTNHITFDAMKEAEVSLPEWHADKQAAMWMREICPDEAKNLKKAYQEEPKIIFVFKGVNDVYAPKAKVIEWLSNRDPLRRKEIVKLGLLWSM